MHAKNLKNILKYKLEHFINFYIKKKKKKQYSFLSNSEYTQ